MVEKDIKDEELAAMQAEAEAGEESVDVVVLTDENGKESYFMEDMIIPYDGKNFAVLVPIDAEDDCCEDEECGCHEHHHHDEECDCEDDDICIIARIDFEEDGEAVYVGPTDEEYEAVAALYDEICESEE